MAPRDTENNAYAKFWGRQTKSVMVCYGISGVVNRKMVEKEKSLTSLLI